MDLNTVITSTIGTVGLFLIVTGAMTVLYFFMALADGVLSLKASRAYHDAQKTIKAEKYKIISKNIGTGITGEEIEELHEAFGIEYIKKIEESTQKEYEQLEVAAKFFSTLTTFLVGLGIVGIFWLWLYTNQ